MVNVNLTDPATQAGFARLVGTSRQAIANLAEKSVFPDGGTFAEWLLVYCERQREMAAGRGGNLQEQLTAIRIEEGRENVAEKRQRRLSDAGELMDRAMVEQWVLAASGNVQTFVMEAGDTILESLSEKYGISIDEDDVLGHLRTALGYVGKAGVELAEHFSGVGGIAGSDTSDTNG
jgi:hypothetical protein